MPAKQFLTISTLPRPKPNNSNKVCSRSQNNLKSKKGRIHCTRNKQDINSTNNNKEPVRIVGRQMVPFRAYNNPSTTAFMIYRV